jgi:hypothetical protein
VHDNFVRAAPRAGSPASRIADEGGACPLTPAPIYAADALNHNHSFLSLGLSARLPSAWSRQLPITSPEEWHSVASVVEAVDLDRVAADDQVRVDVGTVDAHAS